MGIPESDLLRISESRRKKFPISITDSCTEAAMELRKKFGLDIEAGYLHGQPHTWNIDPEGMLYDITADQFGLPRILILPKEDAIDLYGYIPDKNITLAVLEVFNALQTPALRKYSLPL